MREVRRGRTCEHSLSSQARVTHEVRLRELAQWGQFSKGLTARIRWHPHRSASQVVLSQRLGWRIACEGKCSRSRKTLAGRNAGDGVSFQKLRRKIHRRGPK